MSMNEQFGETEFDPNDYMPKLAESQNSTAATTQAMVSRQAQEVQMAMFVAKQFPRDTYAAFNRIMQSCERQKLAEEALYEYPKGGQMVTGPSIRLAESLAQSWGNLDFGILELDQKNGESNVMSYAWDLETNTRQTKVFTVKHERSTKKGITKLTDPRDIYEMVANQGARRLRNCILGVIPGDVVDAAVKQCEKTLTSGHKEPLQDRVRKMITAFQKDYGVNKEMIEQVAGCTADAFTEQLMLKFTKIFRSLKDGMASREQFFDIRTGKSAEVLNDTEKAFKEASKNKRKDGVDNGDASAEIAATNTSDTDQQQLL